MSSTHTPLELKDPASHLEAKRTASLDRWTLVLSRQQLAISGLTFLMLAYLIAPMVRLLPAGLGVFNRPIIEMLDLILVASWIVARLVFGSSIRVKPALLEMAFWLVPLSTVISAMTVVLRGDSLALKHVYALVNALRPLALVEWVVLISLWSKLAGGALERLVKSLYSVLGMSIIYIGVLAILQYWKVGPVQDFLYQFYRYDFSESLLDIVYTAIDVYGRATSIFHWANSLGMFIAIALIVLASYLWEHRQTRWLYAAVLVGLFGLILSGSRASLIALVIGLLCITLLYRRFREVFLLGFGALIVFLALSFIEAQTGSSSRLIELINYLTGAGPIPATFATRLVKLQLGIDFITSSPSIFWAGISVTGSQARTLMPFDNEYLMYSIWNGTLGLLAFLGTQLALIFYSLWVFRRSQRLSLVRLLALSVFSVFTSMSLAAFSQNVWTQDRLMQMVFIFFGVFVYTIRQGRAARQTITEPAAAG